MAVRGTAACVSARVRGAFRGRNHRSVTKHLKIFWLSTCEPDRTLRADLLMFCVCFHVCYYFVFNYCWRLQMLMSRKTLM